MNLIDAINSGRPFKRQNRPWIEDGGLCLEYKFMYPGPPIRKHGKSTYDPKYEIDLLKISLDDLLADDWEVKEDLPIPITAKQFWDAYAHGLKDRRCEFNNENIVAYMARTLGLAKK